ncbi:MAG: deoxyribodipyrimidine photo-lyase [Rhodospirillales bacterium]|nr:deoxyribodipyrimidine photo-lyase [Rhodospirillales bacterium]
MSHSPVILWFRQDLRLGDNLAVLAAYKARRPVFPVFILDDKNAGVWKHGGASRWWLHKSLQALNEKLGGTLRFYRGDARQIIPDLAKEYKAQAVFWNRCYEPWRTERDKQIKATLKNDGIQAESFKANLLFEPWEHLKADGTPYKVFTPYYKSILALDHLDERIASGLIDDVIPEPFPGNQTSLEDLDLLAGFPWQSKLEQHWQPGEDGAHKVLHHFIEGGLSGYAINRDRVDDFDGISHLSPYLHWGEIAPHRVWEQLTNRPGAESFRRQLIWREFAHHTLYHFPALPEKPLHEEFKNFPWYEDDDTLRRWQKGLTGYPLVDAGMRELWATGTMHNRARMVVASFLVKHLLIHWHAGQTWFWDTLVDADLANNAFGWQWVAGCGADASPYFRIFNPYMQAEKFDPDEAYIKKWLPEYGTTDYPKPMIDHKAARVRALAAYQEMKEA